MSNYIERVNNFAKYGAICAEQFVNDFGELFLSISEQEVFEQIASITRLREDIPAPQSVREAYMICAQLLVELFQQKRVRFLHPLSTLGNADFQRLLELVRRNGSTDPRDVYSEAVALYKNDVNAFNARRAAEPQFLEMSNRAQELGLLV
jgi:hypothetical protein